MDRSPREVAERFIRAVGERDAQAMTSMLDQATLDEAVQAARAAGWNVSNPTQAISRLYGATVASVLGQVQIESVEIVGDTARVVYAHPTYGRDEDDAFFLRRLGERWLVHLPAPEGADETSLRRLADAFFAAIDPELSASGWRASVAAPYEVLPREGRYFRPSDSAMLTPVAQVSYVDLVGREPFVEVSVGMTCPPAERVLSRLRATLCNLTVGDDASTELPLAQEADVSLAAAAATRLIDERWAVVARSIPELVALIDALRAMGDDEETHGLQIPAILAAGGHIEDARASLRAYRTSYDDSEFDQWADDFERYLDAGAIVPPPGAEAFPPRP